jgi:5-methylcytosine-specific restriction endonuclease McrA
MPRKSNFTEEQISFILENADKGGIWLSEQLNVDRAWIYQWGTDNKISVKKRDYPVREMKIKANKWPRRYNRYKQLLVMRDGLRCHYCDYLMTYDEVQVDHVKAKARGGSDAPHNLVLACARCNGLKSTLCYTCPEFRDVIGNGCQ